MRESDSTNIDIFDYYRHREESIFLQVREGLGATFDIVYDVLRLYETFIQHSLNTIWKLDDLHQPAALMHTLQWLKHEAIAGTMTLMRGHITDASNFNRRAIELCAFIQKIYLDPEAAKRWMEAGNSKKARERYESAFPAFQLVRDHLPAELIEMYKHDCLDVHPSFFAIAKRASLGDDRIHRFRYFDLDEQDDSQTFLIMEFMSLVYCHARIMEYLATVFNQSGCFNQEDWHKTYLPFVEKFKALREEWRPTFDKHFELMDSEVAAEKKVEKDLAKTKKQAQKETKQLQSEPSKSTEKKGSE